MQLFTTAYTCDSKSVGSKLTIFGIQITIFAYLDTDRMLQFAMRIMCLALQFLNSDVAYKICLSINNCNYVDLTYRLYALGGNFCFHSEKVVLSNN